jgi:DNA polymerase III subunit epsilon
MNNSFTAIDFETANGKRWSISQAGLVRMKNGIISEQLSLLVQPPNNYYRHNFTEIHGITAKHTANAPTVSGIWKQIEPYITGQNVVTHNWFAFGFQCLNQTLEYNKKAVSSFSGHSTFKIFRANFEYVC